MADVRLTATNPDDSSVVPVACTSAGLLRVEPQVQGPPGEDGEKGDKGDKGDPGAPGQDGDPFSGNFTGDVSFNGNVGIRTNDRNYSINIKSEDTDVLGTAASFSANEDQRPVSLLFTNDSGNKQYGFIMATDSQEIKIGPGESVNTTLKANGKVGIGTDRPSTKFSVNNLAGFTEEGYLWCTTRRGDTVILDFTSNGMGMWEPYTPPAREMDPEDLMELADEIRDKLESGSNADEIRDKLEGGSNADEIRDKPEDGSTTDIDSLRPKGD